MAKYPPIRLLPTLIYQGIRVRLTTPRLPEASLQFTGQSQGNNPPIRLIVLGESTVAGVGAPNHEQAITGQIAQALAQKTQRTIHWQAMGKNGFTAKKVQLELVPKLEPYSADIIVIALGVNDTTRLHSTERWSNDMRDLVGAIWQRLPDVPIAISAIPPVRDFPVLPQPLRRVLGERAQALDNATIRLVKTFPNAIHIPFPPDMMITPEYFCADRFHPSPKGYAVWGEHLASAIVSAFFSAGD